MRFTTQRGKLSVAISNVSKAVAVRSAIQSLEGVLIKIKENEIELCAYDLEFSISTTLPATNTIEGDIVLPANRFGEMLKKLGSDTVTVEVDEKCLVTVTGGKTVYTILGIPALDFPQVPPVNNDNDICIDSLVFKNMIDRTIFAVSDDEERVAYTGLLFDFDIDKLSVIGVDGFRMAVRSEKIKNDIKRKLIVPSKTLREITRLMEEEESNTLICFTLKKILFKIGNYTVFSRLLDGEYFKYKEAVPTAFKTSFEIERKLLLNSLDRMSLIVVERLKNPVRCSIKDGEITMNVDTTIGKASDTIECAVQGEELYMGFNCRYMLECLRACESEKISVKISGPLSPIIIEPLNEDNALYLVLPIRIK